MTPPAVITRDQCTEIASKRLKFHVQIESFSLSRIVTDKGHLGEYHQLNIRLNDGAVLDFFVKMPLSSPNRPEFVNPLTEKECGFYCQMISAKMELPELDVSFMPECYCSCKGMLVLDNLGGQGYTTVESFDVVHVKLACRNLARLHAVTLVYEKVTGKPFSGQYLEEGMFSKNPDCVGNVYIRAITEGICRLIQEEQVQVSFRRDVEKCLDLLNGGHGFHNVCCHGDLWRNNVMFKCNGSTPVDSKLVDFQLVRWTPPAHDLTTLIYHNVPNEVIQEHIEDFVEEYYSSLEIELDKYHLKVCEVLPKTEYLNSVKVFTGVAKLTRLLYTGYEAATKLRRMQKVKAPLDEIMTENNYSFIADVVKVDENLASIFFQELADITSAYTPITSEICSSVVTKKVGNVEYDLVNFDLSPLHAFDKERFRLNVVINQGDTLKQLKFRARIFVEKFADSFRREARYYEHFGASRFVREVAVNHYATQPDEAIVFEELHDYELVNPRKPFSIDEIKCVLAAVAKLHATGFQGCLTILHGNLTPNTVLLKYENSTPTACKLQDFGSYKLGSPADDFLSFLYTAALQTLLHYCLDEFKQFYYQELCAATTELGCDLPLSFDEFLESCKICTSAALERAVEYHKTALIREKILAYNGDPEDEELVLEVTRSSMLADPIYVERLDEIVNELEKLKLGS